MYQHAGNPVENTAAFDRQEPFHDFASPKQQRHHHEQKVVRSLSSALGGGMNSGGLPPSRSSSQSNLNNIQMMGLMHQQLVNNSSTHSGGGGGGGGNMMMTSQQMLMHQAQQHSNVYVKNLAEDVDELTLKGVFDRFGTVESCCVIRDVSTNSSRGFGFVKFDLVHQAEAAIQNMHGKLIRGRVLEVGSGRPRCFCFRSLLFTLPARRCAKKRTRGRGPSFKGVSSSKNAFRSTLERRRFNIKTSKQKQQPNGMHTRREGKPTLALGQVCQL
jgi:hypothetical protein